MKKYFIAAAVLASAVIGLLVFVLWPSQRPTLSVEDSPYFAYTDAELAGLREHASDLTMEADELYAWDEASMDLVRRGTLVSGFDPVTSRIYTYVLVAERDAALLSYRVSGRYAGSLAPVASRVLCEFFPVDCPTIRSTVTADAYSDRLAEVVLAKVRVRMEEEERALAPYQLQQGSAYWNLTEKIGVAEGSRKPWYLTTGSQFRSEPPPAHGSSDFLRQVELVREARANATDAQKLAAATWAGGPGTKTPPGQWLDIADDHLREQGASFETALHARWFLVAAIADATIAVFDGKYTYQVRRPFMEIPTLVTVMPTPSHPAYPSGHSTLSAAAAVILTHFFPESADRWDALSEEAGLSRVWAGIHYPMDHESGKVLGERVADEVLRVGRQQ